MKKKYLYIDSSDDEKENNVIKNITKISYNNYLLTNILNIKGVNSAAELKENLGLILHNLADRLCGSPAINSIYQKIKGQKLNLNENTYKKILIDIKTAFNKKLTQLFTDDNKENNPADEDYIQLFDFVFNKKTPIPEIFTLKSSIKIVDVRKILLKELQTAKINLKPLYKNPLNIDIENSNSNEILSCSKVVNRNNKNKIKYLTVVETDKHSSSSIYNISNSQLDSFTDIHVIHYHTGNVQTEIFGFGNYKEILQKIPQNALYRSAMVKCIFNIIQNKEINIEELEITQGLNNFAEQLAHLLFIVEMQRNNATLFTAPMFLELIVKDEKYLKYEKFFPMSAKTAVSQARGVAKDNDKKLPNTHIMDYDITNVKKSDLLLKREGNILIEWLTGVIGNNKLNCLAEVYNGVALTKIIKKKEIEHISIKELQDFLGEIDKIENCPHNLLTALKESLNNLIPNFGKRPEQYLNLAKENLLKKNIFTEDIKDLIEVTYCIFEETLHKLESFLLQTQKKLAADIEQALPEILTILCEKIKEWYNIEVPEYVTANPLPKDVKDSKILRDITNSNNNAAKSLKISFPNPCKRKMGEENIENDSNKILKILMEQEANNLLNTIDEFLLMGDEEGGYNS
ncbi:hypothetical protein [Rickettsia endosymbiont of Halotydeus destructor]|uniref:hypothetical protein n=1 Tax=Rickettsia endosymbiont of Halotydeus destructor TaxID=2996754 RepID=UPI003BB2198F